MPEERSQASTVLEAERYFAEHVRLDSTTAGSPHGTLQESMN
jgi:hypothetical protein